MKYQSWRPDALNDVQRMINRTLHITSRCQSGARRRSAGSPGTGGIRHPFQVTVSGDTCTVAGGYVIGYNEAVYLQDKKIPNSSGASFFYIAVRPDVNNHVISAEIELTGKKEHRENGVYYYPVAEWKEDKDGVRTLIQHQFGNLVTPFRRNYIPVIDASLQCLLKVREGEGDEIKFILQDDASKGGPLGNQHLCTKHNKDLYWHRCIDDDNDESSSSSGSSGSSSGSSGSGTDSGSSSSMIDDLEELIPGKWYVFVRYYRNEGEAQIMYQGSTFNTRETFHTEGWGKEIGRWTEEYVKNELGIFLIGYYFNAVVGGPFESVDECAEWWQQNGHMYDPDMEPPETL